jgi:hypothetical protein
MKGFCSRLHMRLSGYKKTGSLFFRPSEIGATRRICSGLVSPSKREGERGEPGMRRARLKIPATQKQALFTCASSNPNRARSSAPPQAKTAWGGQRQKSESWPGLPPQPAQYAFKLVGQF